jgi:hypothetical protein
MNTPTIKLTETDTLHSGYQFYDKYFTTMDISEIEKLLQPDLRSLHVAGYNSFLLHRASGTVSCRKVEVKTLQDVFETDMYGIL